MALSATTVWEVRTTGSDTNGGGFVPGSGGTDYSQQSTAQISVTDAVANGTTTITSATAGFTSAVTGNLVYLAGGSGSLAAGWYQATYVSSTSITVDRTVAAGTGIILHLGGALATPNQAITNAVSDNTIWLKSGTYTTSTTLPAMAAGSSGGFTALIGYGSTRGDNTKATIQLTTSTNLVAQGNALCLFRNIIFDGNSTGQTGINTLGSQTIIYNCVAQNFTTGGFNIATGQNVKYVYCYATGQKTGAYGFHLGGDGSFYGCVAYNNSGPGWQLNGFGGTLINCISANNGTVGFGNAGRSLLVNCTAYGNGSDGIQAASGSAGVFINNIVESNTGWGINFSSASNQFLGDYNGYFNNTGGAVQGSNFDGTHDVTLGAEAFANPAGQNFALNNSNPGGARARGAGFPQLFPGISTSGYTDIGAVQHQDSGTGTSGPVGFAFS